jgi:hypothetical protein
VLPVKEYRVQAQLGRSDSHVPRREYIQRRVFVLCKTGIQIRVHLDLECGTLARQLTFSVEASEAAQTLLPSLRIQNGDARRKYCALDVELDIPDRQKDFMRLVRTPECSEKQACTIRQWLPSVGYIVAT